MKAESRVVQPRPCWPHYKALSPGVKCARSSVPHRERARVRASERGRFPPAPVLGAVRPSGRPKEQRNGANPVVDNSGGAD